MSNQPKLFRVNPDTQETADLKEVEFTALGFQERDIQEWIATNPSVLDDDFLIVAREFSGFDATRERLDLLAVDPHGELVVIELKRDDSGADVHWQAIKYASYLHGAGQGKVIDMLARHEDITNEEAKRRITEHISSEEGLDCLNENQRIVLVSHRFAQEVTSASLWLNEQTGRSLVTCIQLTPYSDDNSNSLFISATTIIPTPGAEEYQIGIGTRSGDKLKIARRSYSNKTDDITDFCKKIKERVLNVLPNEVRPDKTSRWAGGPDNERRYRFWYSQQVGEGPVYWGRSQLSYRIILFRDENNGETWEASILLYNGYRQGDTLPEELLDELQGLDIEMEVDDRGIWINCNCPGGLTSESKNESTFGWVVPNRLTR